MQGVTSLVVRSFEGSDLVTIIRLTRLKTNGLLFKAEGCSRLVSATHRGSVCTVARGGRHRVHCSQGIVVRWEALVPKALYSSLAGFCTHACISYVMC